MRLSGRSRRASLLGALTLMSSLVGGGLASADTWPISRHDAAHPPIHGCAVISTVGTSKHWRGTSDDFDRERSTGDTLRRDY